MVAVSGTVRAAVGLGGWSGLDSAYGVILIVKVAALLIASACSAPWYRTRLIARLREDAAAQRFWWLVTLELAFMGIASGAAAALARTAPPNGEQLPAVQTPAEILTGSPLAAGARPSTRWFTAWDIDLLWLFVCGFATLLLPGGRGPAASTRRRVADVPHDLLVLGVLLLFWVDRRPGRTPTRSTCSACTWWATCC